MWNSICPFSRCRRKTLFPHNAGRTALAHLGEVQTARPMLQNTHKRPLTPTAANRSKHSNNGRARPPLGQVAAPNPPSWRNRERTHQTSTRHPARSANMIGNAAPGCSQQPEPPAPAGSPAKSNPPPALPNMAAAVQRQGPRRATTTSTTRMPTPPAQAPVSSSTLRLVITTTTAPRWKPR